MALLVRQDVGEVTRPTIEDVLARTEVCGEGLFTATADGPIVSADGQLVVHRTDLKQSPIPISNRFGTGRIEEGKRIDLTELQCFRLKDYRRQVSSLDLRRRKL